MELSRCKNQRHATHVSVIQVIFFCNLNYLENRNIVWTSGKKSSAAFNVKDFLVYSEFKIFTFYMCISTKGSLLPTGKKTNFFREYYVSMMNFALLRTRTES